MTQPDDAVQYRKLSVIVPVYDERNTVVEIVRRMRAVDIPLEREFVLVDDGSTDGTREVLRQLADSTVRVVYHEKNQGKGAAIRSGLAQVTGDLVLVQDADLEYDPEDWPKLLAPVLRGQGAGGLRLALHRRAPQHAVPALGRQPVPLAGHERALQHDALRHGDVLQAVRPTRARRHHVARVAVRLRARGDRQGAPARASASTRCRSPTRGASSTRERRSRGATGSWHCGPSSSTASSTSRERGRTRTCAAVGGGRRELRSGPLLAACIRSLLADTSAGEPGARRRRQRFARRLGRRARPRVPGGARARPRERTSGTREVSNRGVAATRRAGRRGRECRRRSGSRAPRPRCSHASTAEPDLAAVGPVVRNPDGSQYPSARTVPSTERRRRPRAVRRGAPVEPLHPPLPPARRRSRPAP